ncbi:serine/threonine-protein phosphatase 2b catalytic subunit 1-related [Anaeramoeba flamelloides]|uniref:Serine/threonine-protein phosphatase 2b catalytic subunit 1-related n=1 Tax=Anaeramoeba flamelloides TaxID=1746091 RepID=A0AAV7ZKC3_9EUKA|nr:serine/threonine-protein phosphatase 2b catalytic subunit 1-related [Anaeramoeba flamelloides]
MSQTPIQTETTKKHFKKEQPKENSETKPPLNCGEDRIVPNVPEPIRGPMEQSVLFPENSLCPDHIKLRYHLKNEGLISKTDLMTILKLARNILKKEDNLLYIESPVTIFGDLHGQFYDLLNFIETCGDCDPEKNKYLFLGDYVDRGMFGVETVIYLLALKICFPKGCFLLREVYDEIMNTFDCLPLTAIVDKHFFCVHGGLSPKLQKVEIINQINRFQEPPTNGLYGDLLWSDPDPQYNQPLTTQRSFSFNNIRGCSYHYTFHAVSKFLTENKLTTVIRAHEAKPNGFVMYLKRKETKIPSLITIFSAPNYLDLYGNKGAVIKYHKKAVSIKEFNAVGHPYYLPKFIDVFKWTIPFISERISSIWETYTNLTPQHLLQNLQLNDSKKNKKETNETKDTNETKETNETKDTTQTQEDSQKTGEAKTKNDSNTNKAKKVGDIEKNPKKLIKSNAKIFLDHRRGETIKLKVLLMCKLMFDFAKIRRQRGGNLRNKIHRPIKFRRTQSLMFNTIIDHSQSPLFNRPKRGMPRYLRSQSVEDLAKLEEMKEQKLVNLLKKSSIQIEKPINSNQNVNVNINNVINGSGSEKYQQIEEINFIENSQNKEKIITKNKFQFDKNRSQIQNNEIEEHFEKISKHSIAIKSITKNNTNKKSKQTHPLGKLNSFQIKENESTLSQQVHPKKEN